MRDLSVSTNAHQNFKVAPFLEAPSEIFGVFAVAAAQPQIFKSS